MYIPPAYSLAVHEENSQSEMEREFVESVAEMTPPLPPSHLQDVNVRLDSERLGVEDVISTIEPPPLVRVMDVK